jgi:hypothetical protein
MLVAARRDAGALHLQTLRWVNSPSRRCHHTPKLLLLLLLLLLLFHRKEHNFRKDLREIGWEGVDWMDLAQDRDQWWALVNTIMNL